mgnify:CR=1 FL=1
MSTRLQSKKTTTTVETIDFLQTGSRTDFFEDCFDKNIISFQPISRSPSLTCFDSSDSDSTNPPSAENSPPQAQPPRDDLDYLPPWDKGFSDMAYGIDDGDGNVTCDISDGEWEKLSTLLTKNDDKGISSVGGAGTATNAIKKEREESSGTPKKKKRRPFSKEERLERNRLAAALSREKKKVQIDSLQAQVARLSNLLAIKDAEIATLKSENARLRSNRNTEESPLMHARKRARGGRHGISSTQRGSSSITASMKIGLAASVAVCIFGSFGTEEDNTAFVLSGMSKVSNARNVSWTFLFVWLFLGVSTFLCVERRGDKSISKSSKSSKWILPFWITRAQVQNSGEQSKIIAK